MTSIKEQLTTAISLISTYEVKLDRYAQHVVTLNTKLEEYQNKVSREHRELTYTPPTRSTQAALAGPIIQEPKPTKVPKQGSSTPLHTQSRLLKASNTEKIKALESVTVGGTARLADEVVHDDHHKTSHINDVEIVRGSDDDVTFNTQQWTKVKSRKNRTNTTLCGTAGPTTTTLKAVEPVRYIHLWNMASNADDVLQYLKQLCPTGSCTVEELIPKGNYKSYKLGVPEAHYEACFSIDVWPINARIKPWVTLRKPVGPLRTSVALEMTSSNQLPFRGSKRAQ